MKGNELEINGTITHVLPIESGVGKNGEWKRQDFVVKTQGQYSRTIAINLSGKSLDFAEKSGLLSVGMAVNCHINVESREYNGRWYTQVTAWKIEKAST